MTGNTIFAYKLLLSLNISDFNLGSTPPSSRPPPITIGLDWIFSKAIRDCNHPTVIIPQIISPDLSLKNWDIAPFTFFFNSFSVGIGQPRLRFALSVATDCCFFVSETRAIPDLKKDCQKIIYVDHLLNHLINIILHFQFDQKCVLC